MKKKNDTLTAHIMNSSQVCSPIFNIEDKTLLKKIRSDKSLVIYAPDKGRGKVMLKGTDNEDKITPILSDTSKFRKLTNTDAFRETIAQEDRIKRMLTKINDNSITPLLQYDTLCTSGRSPGSVLSKYVLSLKGPYTGIGARLLHCLQQMCRQLSKDYCGS